MDAADIVRFKELGYLHLRRVLDADRIAPALAEARRLQAADPEAARRAWWSTDSADPAFRDLLRLPPLRDLVDRLIAWPKVDHQDGAQVPIVRARGDPAPRPVEYHLDGFNAPGEYYPCALIVAVFLTGAPASDRGNLAVWPRSHHAMERYWRERDRTALTAGMPRLDVGEPVQLVVDAGDVVLFHFQLAHGAAANTGDVDRVAAYFRLWMGIDHWEQATNLWSGWRI